MSKDELLNILRTCASNRDTECAHLEADDAVIAFINDPDITAAYEAIPMWYA